MSWTDTDIDYLRARMERLEEVVNRIQTPLTNVATSEALNQIILIKSRDIEDMKVDIIELRNAVDLLQAEVLR